MMRRPPRSPLFPSTTLFRSEDTAEPASASPACAVPSGAAHALDRDTRAVACGRSTDDLTVDPDLTWPPDRKSTRQNSSHANISYAVFCLKNKKELLSSLLGL